jgi:hypothetical protein
MGEGSISILPTGKDKTRGTCDEQNGEREREKRQTKSPRRRLLDSSLLFFFLPFFGK